MLMYFPNEATQTCQTMMPSSRSSSPSPSEETYHTAEEGHSLYAQSSESDSVYATANQTPAASPDVNEGIFSSDPIAAEDQRPAETNHPIEESTEERRESASSNVTAAPRGSFITHQAEARRSPRRRRGLGLQQEGLKEPENEERAPGKLASFTFCKA